MLDDQQAKDLAHLAKQDGMIMHEGTFIEFNRRLYHVDLHGDLTVGMYDPLITGGAEFERAVDCPGKIISWIFDTDRTLKNCDEALRESYQAVPFLGGELAHVRFATPTGVMEKTMYRLGTGEMLDYEETRQGIKIEFIGEVRNMRDFYKSLSEYLQASPGWAYSE